MIDSNDAIGRDDSSGNVNSYSYFCDFNSVLPQNVNKFNISFSLRSTFQNGYTIGNACVLSINFMCGTNTFSPGCRKNVPYTAVIDFIQVSGRFNYDSDITNNVSRTISRPQSSLITLTLIDLGGTTISGMPTLYRYYLEMKFTPVKEVDRISL